MDRQKIANDFAQAMVNKWYEIREGKSILASVTQEDIARTKERFRQQAEQLMDEIVIKHLLWDRMRNGRFHPDNKASRKLFAEFTGISLPATVGGTVRTIMEHLGLEWCKQKEADERAAYEAEQAAEHERMRAEQVALMEKLIAKMPCEVNGSQLLEMARHLGVEVHPRTAGVLKRVSRMWKEGKTYYAEHSKRGLSLNGATEVYFRVCQVIEERHADAKLEPVPA